MYKKSCRWTVAKQLKFRIALLKEDEICGYIRHGIRAIGYRDVVALSWRG